MLSNDELKDGIPFILKLADADGTARQWIESLSGPAAEHWYNIYRNSDWDALRKERADVFCHAATQDEAEHVRRSRRCVVIKLDDVAEAHAGKQSSTAQQSRCGDSGSGDTSANLPDVLGR